MYPKYRPNKYFKRCLWLIAAFLFLGSSCAPSQAASRTLDEIGTVEEIRTLLPSEWGVRYPTGLSYSLDADHLVMLEKRSFDSAPAGETTVVVITPYEDLVGTVSIQFPADNHINVSFDDSGDRLLLLNNELAELAQIEQGNDRVIDPTTLTRVDIAHLGLANVQGMDVDVRESRLFLLDSAAFQVVIVDLDAGFRLVSKVELSHLCAPNLRGLAVHPTSGNLFVVSPAEQLLYELTQSGQLVNRYDLANLALMDPRGLDFGPSADLTDPSDTIHLFMADSNLPAVKAYLPLIARRQDRGVVDPADTRVSAQPRAAAVFGKVLELALHPGSTVNPTQRITLQVASSHDDAEERHTSGSIDLESTDLELVQAGGVDQMIDLRSTLI
jgi:hypothetical protein